MKDYHIFESIRKNKEQGGTLLGVQVGLKPVLIKEYNDTFELLVVEVNVANKNVRLITGYGPQENWDINERTPFYTALEEEIAAAELQGRSIIITMDANAKLGPDFIAEDPYNQSPNGKLLAGLVSRHALCVANGLTEKRKGSITRQKNTVLGVQKSIIDFVIASSDLIEHIIEIHIDEERVNVLKKNLKTKTGIEYIESDHNVINTKLKLSWSPDECKVIEVFKYADKEAQERFRKETTETNHLSSIINMKKPIDIVTNEFLKRLKGFIHKCFKKVKIMDQPNKEL